MLKRKLMLLALSTVLTAAAVVLIGWFSSFQEVMHGALVSVLVFAFLPFLIIFGILVLVTIPFVIILLLALPLAILGDGDVDIGLDGADLSRMVASLPGGGMIAGYYALLIRINHPVFWGVPVGVLIGGVIIWGIIGFIILPGETKTAEILVETQERIEEVYKKKGGYPQPDKQGHLPHQAFAGDGQETRSLVVDGFDRPLVYKVTGKWKFASYKIISLGFDGRPGKDDLCVAGATKAMKLADGLTGTLQWIAGFKKDRNKSIGRKLEAVRVLKCPAAVDRR